MLVDSHVSNMMDYFIIMIINNVTGRFFPRKHSLSNTANWV